jgi:hypothetical protein
MAAAAVDNNDDWMVIAKFFAWLGFLLKGLNDNDKTTISFVW